MFQIQFQFLKQSKNETKFQTLVSSSKTELEHSKNEKKLEPKSFHNYLGSLYNSTKQLFADEMKLYYC